MAGESPCFLQALPAERGPEAVRTRVQERDLEQWGLTGEPACEAAGRAGAGRALSGAARSGPARPPERPRRSDSAQSALPRRLSVRTRLLPRGS